MTATATGLAGAGGTRRLHARWLLTCDLELVTPALLAGDGDGGVDIPVLRDALEDLPMIPGTSLGGALRAHLADRLAGYGAAEPAEVAELFGAGRGDDQGGQSAIIVYDARASSGATEIRAGVALDPESGTAKRGALFDFELVPRGTTFPLRFELLVPGRGRFGEQLSDDQTEALERSLLGLLAAALEGLGPRGVALGGRRARGLGEVCAAGWRAQRFALATEEQWGRWLDAGAEHEIPGDPEDAVAEAIEAAHADVSLPRSAQPDRRKRALVSATVVIGRGGMLIGEAGALDKGPDRRQLRSNGEPVVSGSALGGALRSQARVIANLLRSEIPCPVCLIEFPDAEAWVVALLGGSDGRTTVASRLRVGERLIDRHAPACETRIALDRWTQAPVSGALFQEEVARSGTWQLELELRNPAEAEIGLLLLTVRDLLESVFALGGTGSVGRGEMSAAEVTVEAFDRRLTLPVGGGAEPPAVDLAALPVGRGSEPRPEDRVDDWIAAFRDAPARGLAQRPRSASNRDCHPEPTP